MTINAYITTPPEHVCRVGRTTCEACGEGRCADCLDAPRHFQHVVCGDCHKRNVSECASCCALVDPDAVTRQEWADYVELGWCPACVVVTNGRA